MRLRINGAAGVALLIVGLAAPGLAQSTSGEGEPIEGGTGDLVTPMLVSLVGGDTAAVLGSDGRYHEVHELLLVNTAPGIATLKRVTVLDAADQSEVVSLAEADMIAGEALRTLDRQPVPNANLAANESRVLLLTTSFAKLEDVPASLTHRLEVLSPSPFTSEPVSFNYVAGALDLSQRTPPVLSPPLVGEGWVASDGCCDPSSHHRNGLFPINGGLHAGQRFAIDWLGIDTDGRLAAGDASDIANWVAYGAPVLAATAGTVVTALDGLEDQVPGVMPEQDQMTLDEADGNHVVLDHGDGLYSFYAHLQPGSVAVAVGESVGVGEQLGLLGNSGASGAPHLHFHVMRGPSPSGSDGFPFVIDYFQLGGTADPDALLGAIQGEAVFPARDELVPVAHEQAMPLSYAVVDFPEP
jgi:hypothetical protein